jgi:hypothetical protein
MPLPANYVPRHKISHLWIPQDVANGSPDAMSAATLTWAGTGTMPGFSIQTYQGRRCWLFDDAGTGSVASKIINAGNSSGSGAPQSSSFTVLMSVYLQSLPGANMSLYTAKSGGIQVRITTAGMVGLVARAVAAVGASSVAVRTGRWETFGVSYDGEVGRFVVGGVAAGSASAVVSFNRAQQQFFGSDDIGTEVVDNGVRVEYLATIDKAMSHAEMIDVGENLARLFMPSRVPTVTLSITTSTNIEIPTAALTLTAPAWTVTELGFTSIEIPTARATFEAGGFQPDYTATPPPPAPPPPAVSGWTPVTKTSGIWTPK